MILRAAAVGFLMWLLATAAFRFYGDVFFAPSLNGVTILLWISAPVMAGLTVLLIRLLRVSRGDEAEAAIGLAFPGMALDVFVMRYFGSVFPNLDPTLDSEFGALLLAAYATIIFTGLVMTRLSPQDERL